MKISKYFYYLMVASFLFLTACSDDDPSTDNSAAEEVDSASDLVVAIPNDASDLNVQGANSIDTGTIKSHIFETLLTQDENMDIQSGLAEDYNMIDDLTWEFHLREGVTFHDDTPFNAEAVKTNFDRMFDPEVASAVASQFDMVEEVQVIDDYTVHFVLSEPFMSLPKSLTHYTGAIMSPKSIEDDYAGDVNLDTNPVGTGPFVFEEWEHGNEIVLVENDDYWGEPAQLDSLTYKVVPEENTRIAMLSNGEAHVITNITSVNTDQVEQMDNASLLAEDSVRVNTIEFNTEKEPLNDASVRQAIASAIDIDQIVEGIYQGYANKPTGPIDEFTFGFNPEVEPYPYDMDAAKQLLVEAGYEDGFSLSIWAANTDAQAIQKAEYIQDQLSELNIDLSIEQVEFSTLVSESGAGDHDIVITGWSNSIADPNDALYRIYHSNNHGSAGNRMFYTNEQVDELLWEARQEDDDANREAMYQEAQAIIAEDIPRIAVASPQYLFGVSDDVEGFVQYLSSHHSFKNATVTGGVTQDGGY
ncbi:glutathione ABC transporter substrate-binding protein [Virgibacillus oceani]